MGIALYIAIALLLQIPVMLSLIALAVVVQRTSQAAYLRTLDNREKQLAFVVQNVINQLGDLSAKMSMMHTESQRRQALLEEIQKLTGEKQHLLVDMTTAIKLVQSELVPMKELLLTQSAAFKRTIENVASSAALIPQGIDTEG